MKRMLLAALVGGVVLFVWMLVAFEVLPLGKTGVKVLPPAAEKGVREGLQAGLQEPGFYFFPGVDNWPHPSEQDLETMQAKWATGPQGIVVVQPAGYDPGFMLQLAKELALDLICALVMAVVLMHVPKSMGYLRRAGIGALLGAYGAVDIDGSYNVWRYTPGNYFAAQFLIAVIGAFLAGLAVAALVDAPERTAGVNDAPQ
jgi:hypothetical protein